MRRLKAVRVVAVLALALVAAGCAWLLPPQAAGRCGETPESAAEMFLRGIAEFNLPLILRAIPKGWHPFEIFGGRNRKAGQITAKQIFQHPDVVPSGSSVGMVPSLISLEHVSGDMWKATIKREDLVTADNRDDEVRVYQRAFLVRFDREMNCITAVRALDPEWQRLP